ncbi:transposase family protein [Streptomyces sp. MK5]|uniref:transposase family protein n=1 Tax=Streptomyces sp. MK5 TaxID=3064253 RepID=UPI002740FF06|nr:transposase family protein [Streptomyces sp. MK5]
MPRWRNQCGVPSAIDLSTSSLGHLTRHLYAHRLRTGTRWRRLTAGRQALLALAHLRCGDTYAQLATGFGISAVYRYVREAIEVLAALAPTLADAVQTARTKAFVILNGTLLAIDRIAADRPFYSGEHKRHGMNVQVLTDPFGRLLWVSPALPGAVHDIKAARAQGIIEALAEAGVRTWADNGCQGARGTIRVPYRGRWSTLPAGKRAVNSCHAKIRAIGEQANATLKGWRLLRKLRCSTTRITDIVKTVLALRLAGSV